MLKEYTFGQILNFGATAHTHILRCKLVSKVQNNLSNLQDGKRGVPLVSLLLGGLPKVFLFWCPWQTKQFNRVWRSTAIGKDIFSWIQNSNKFIRQHLSSMTCGYGYVQCSMHIAQHRSVVDSVVEGSNFLSRSSLGLCDLCLELCEAFNHIHLALFHIRF